MPPKSGAAPSSTVHCGPIAWGGILTTRGAGRTPSLRRVRQRRRYCDDLAGPAERGRRCLDTVAKQQGCAAWAKGPGNHPLSNYSTTSNAARHITALAPTPASPSRANRPLHCNNGMIVLGIREAAYKLGCGQATVGRTMREIDDAGLARPTTIGAWRGMLLEPRCFWSGTFATDRVRTQVSKRPCNACDHRRHTSNPRGLVASRSIFFERSAVRARRTRRREAEELRAIDRRMER